MLVCCLEGVASSFGVVGACVFLTRLMGVRVVAALSSIFDPFETDLSDLARLSSDMAAVLSVLSTSLQSSLLLSFPATADICACSARVLVFHDAPASVPVGVLAVPALRAVW